MIVYFTGTGNSRYCAAFLGEQLGDSCLDVLPLLQSGAAADLRSERPWVFVTPTYAWRLPRLVRDLIRGGRFSGSRDAYFVMTCGEDIGNAAAWNRRLCEEAGLRYRGTLPVVMPENYIALFTAPGAEEAKAILAEARPVLRQAADWIRAGADFPAGNTGGLDRLKSGPVNSLFYRFYVRTGPFTVSDACVSCGKCQRLCPLGNIRIQEGRPVWGTAAPTAWPVSAAARPEPSNTAGSAAASPGISARNDCFCTGRPCFSTEKQGFLSAVERAAGNIARGGDLQNFLKNCTGYSIYFRAGPVIP